MTTLKKSILTVMAALLPATGLWADVVAKVVDAEYETLQDAVEAAADGATVTLTANADLGASSLTLAKGLTIEGAYTITSSADQAVLLQGSGNVTFSKVKIVATKGHGIQAGDDTHAYSGKLSLSEAELTVAKRGVRVYEEDNGFAITIDKSVIQSDKADPTTTYTTGNDAMGLSLGTSDNKGYSVVITDTEIRGFSYDINSVTSGSNLTVSMTGGKTYGRAVLNVWGSNNVLTLNGVEVHGLNNQTGPTEAFACIVDNKGATGNAYNIEGVTFIANLSEAAYTANGSTASEQMIDLRGSNATVKITGETTYTINEGAESRGGLFYNEGALEDNSVLFDATAVSNLSEWIEEAVVSDEADTNGLYGVTYTSDVYYYWIANGSEDGVKASFAEPFAQGWLDNGEYIRLQKDITLTANVVCQLQSGSSFTLTLGDFTLTRGEFNVLLNAGVTVNTDKQTDVFAPADAENYKVTETAVAEGYTYTVEALTDSDKDVVLTDGEAYTVTADTQVKSATYKRSFGEERVGKFQAWFVPFEYTITKDDVQKFKFYKVNMIANSADPDESSETTDKFWIFLTDVAAGDKLEANKPYVFKPLEEAADYEFTTENATLKAPETDSRLNCSTTTDNYDFYGVYDSATPMAENPFYYMNIYGQISLGNDATAVEVGPYRWIIKVTAKVGANGASAAYARTFIFVEPGDNATTGVRSLASDASAEVCCTVDGKQTFAPVKGINIVRTADGKVKKVVIK